MVEKLNWVNDLAHNKYISGQDFIREVSKQIPAVKELSEKRSQTSRDVKKIVGSISEYLKR